MTDDVVAPAEPVEVSESATAYAAAVRWLLDRAEHAGRERETTAAIELEQAAYEMRDNLVRDALDSVDEWNAALERLDAYAERTGGKPPNFAALRIDEARERGPSE